MPVVSFAQPCAHLSLIRRRTRRFAIEARRTIARGPTSCRITGGAPLSFRRYRLCFKIGCLIAWNAYVLLRYLLPGLQMRRWPLWYRNAVHNPKLLTHIIHRLSQAHFNHRRPNHRMASANLQIPVPLLVEWWVEWPH